MAMLPQWCPCCGGAGIARTGRRSTSHAMRGPVCPARRGASGSGGGRPARNSIRRKAGDELTAGRGAHRRPLRAHSHAAVLPCPPGDFATGCRQRVLEDRYGTLQPGHSRCACLRIRSTTTNGSEITRTACPSTEQTRSRPYRSDQPPRAPPHQDGSYRPVGLDLLVELWERVRIKANLFTPSKKPVGTLQHPRRQAPPRLRPAHDPVGEAQTVRPGGPRQRRKRVHPARPARTDRGDHRRTNPADSSAASTTSRTGSRRWPRHARAASRRGSAPTWHTWTGHSRESRASHRKTTTKHQPTPTRISRSPPVRHQSQFRAHFQMRHLALFVPRKPNVS